MGALVLLQSRARGNAGRKQVDVERSGGMNPAPAEAAAKGQFSGIDTPAKGLGNYNYFGLFSPKSPARKEDALKMLESVLREHGKHGMKDLLTKVGYETADRGSHTDRPQALEDMTTPGKEKVFEL